MTVPRGPSLRDCSDAIVAAIEADAEAQQEREEAHRRWSEDVRRAVIDVPTGNDWPA